jgi:transposase
LRSEPSFDLLYLDECEVHLHPTLTKVWTMRGVRPVVPAAGVNRRLCCYGALDYRSGRVHYMVHPKKNAQQFHEFLRQLLEANSERRVVLVVDNASYHRTRRVLALLEEHADHVFVIWLPRYSPELNLIEGLWGYLKRSALNNYFFGDIDTLERAMHGAFAELQQHPDTALSLAYGTGTNLRKTA